MILAKPHLAKVRLRCAAPESVARFYEQRLGMRAHRLGDAFVVGYAGRSAQIELQPALSGPPYEHQRADRYWKIGITLPNIDIACTQLRAAGLAVSDPAQFADVGYLCHLQDPAGFQVELLQHDFAGDRAPHAGDASLALGGGGCVGQITLRVSDIDAALRIYRDRLGMKLLSIQPVNAHGFTLYFLGFTNELPPGADLRAVANRPWLWRRPYTTLELQHRHDGAPPPALPASDRSGFAGVVISGAGQTDLLCDEAGGRIEIN